MPRAAHSMTNWNDNTKARAEMTALPVLDLVYLSRQTLGDVALELELLSTFDRQAGLIMARLDAASDMAQGSKADLVHTLKGSARAVGALALAFVADIHEGVLRAGVGGEVESELKAMLGEAVVAVRADIKRLLA